MTEFNYSASNITDDILKQSAVNVGKAWSDKIEKDLLEKLAKIPSGHQMYLVAVPPAYEVLKMHIEPLDYPDTPYHFRMPFDYAPLRLGGIPIITLHEYNWIEPLPEPAVVWREEPVVEAVPVWQYWVAAAVFVVILCLAGGVV